MDCIEAARGAIVCFRFDLVELRRCCSVAMAISIIIIFRELWILGRERLRNFLTEQQ